MASDQSRAKAARNAVARSSSANVVALARTRSRTPQRGPAQRTTASRSFESASATNFFEMLRQTVARHWSTHLRARRRAEDLASGGVAAAAELSR